MSIKINSREALPHFVAPEQGQCRVAANSSILTIALDIINYCLELGCTCWGSAGEWWPIIQNEIHSSLVGGAS